MVICFWNLVQRCKDNAVQIMANQIIFNKGVVDKLLMAWKLSGRVQYNWLFVEETLGYLREHVNSLCDQWFHTKLNIKLIYINQLSRP